MGGGDMELLDKQALDEKVKGCAAEAMQKASTAPCMACKTETGTPHAFVFAKSEADPGAHVIKYRDFGSLAVPICEKCIKDYQRPIQSRNTLIFWIAFPLTVLLVILGLINLEGLQEVLLGMAAIAGLFIVYTFFWSRHVSKSRIAGQEKALTLFRKELESRGFSDFWTAIEFDPA
jgi:hypothetical protein